MKVRLKFFATYRRYLPSGTQGSATELEVPAGTRVDELLSQFNLPENESCMVLVNGRRVEPHHVLQANDVVAAFPAMAGG